MQELNELELTLLKNLAVKYPQFEYHIQYLKVTERKLTGTGLDTIFEYQNFEGELDDTNALFSNEENIKVNGLKEGLSYVIDITVGQITSIEFSTYNEKWDGKFTDYKIVEKD